MYIISKEDVLQELLNGEAMQIKLVFNHSGAIFGRVAEQHKHLRIHGIWYENDDKGSAMAAMVYGGKIEIRGQKGFGPDMVREVVRKLFAHPACVGLRDYAVTYKGKAIVL